MRRAHEYEIESRRAIEHWEGWLNQNFDIGDYLLTLNLFKIRDAERYLVRKMKAMERIFYGRRCKDGSLVRFVVLVRSPHLHAHILVKAPPLTEDSNHELVMDQIQRNFERQCGFDDEVDIRQITTTPNAAVRYVIGKQYQPWVHVEAINLNPHMEVRRAT
jgi:hypothetical protein